MISEAFLKRVLMFIGVILSGLITLIFISTPKSLEVPVPDELPQITTSSSLNQEFEEAKQFFALPVSDSVPGASIASVISWSPDNKYIVANLTIKTEAKTQTAVYLLDLSRKQYVQVPNVIWADTVSWAGTKLAYNTETGYGVFDADTHVSSTFGGTSNSSLPVISSDGEYVAYADNGIVIYSLNTAKSIRLTSNPTDIPALWESDNKTLVIFTQDETETSLAASSLAELHIGTREIKIIAQLPQSPKLAQWVARDQLALLTLGAADGYFDYTFNFLDGKLKLLAEISEGIAFTSTEDREVATFKGNKIAIYDERAEKIVDAKRSSKTKVVNFSLLPSLSAFLVREKNARYEASLFNIVTSTETVLGDMWLPYAIIAPNGQNAVTVQEGNDSVSFIEIPRR